MKPTHHAATLGAFVVAMAAFLPACQGAPDVDELPAGTPVTVQMQDGRLVTGKLVSVAPEHVVVASEPSGAEVRVVRTNIADVASGDAVSTTPPPAPLVVPSGTSMDAAMETTIASDTSGVEDPIRATLAEPLIVDGATIAPAGSTLLGTVTSASPSGRVRGRAELRVQFTRLQTEDVTYDIRTAPLSWIAEATKGEDATKIGVGAAIGAVIGGVTGGGKGAAVGSAIGAGGGTAVVLATPGRDIRIGSGTRVRVELTAPLTAAIRSAPAAR